MGIHQIFPEPVYFSKLERELTKAELKLINKYKKKTHENIGNTVSTDNYILENKVFKNLKKDLNKLIIDYFNKIVCTNNSIVPYITQSWINYTETNQFHHTHHHSNSYVSGVFYINADKKVDSIKFYKLNYLFSELKLSVSKYNIFNSETMTFPVETGNIVLFPSTLQHGVDQKKGTNTRISLSFNVFFKGTIGSRNQLTETTI